MLEYVSAGTFCFEKRDMVSAQLMSLELVVATIGMEMHKEVAWAAAKLGSRDGREWDDCDEKSSAVGWYETLLAHEFAEIREREWAAEND